MADRRLTFLLIVLLVPAGAALKIYEPEGRTYTDSAIPFNFSGDGHNLTNFTVPSAGISKTLDGTSYQQPMSMDDGTYILTVWTTDDRKERTFTVDTQPPTFLAATPQGQYLSNRRPEITYTAEDLTGITGAEFLLNGTSILSNPTNNATDSYTPDEPDEPLAEGLHEVTVNLTDAYHSWHAMTWTFTLPTQPVISSTAPDGVEDDGDVTVSLTARDPSGIDEEASAVDVDGPGTDTGFDLDEADKDGPTYTYELVGLRSGTYTVDYSIVDGSDEAHTAEGDWEFTVDTLPPNVSITSPLDGDIVTGETHITVNATDSYSRVAEVLFNFAGHSETVHDTPFSTTIDSSGLDTGSAQVMVRATDVADNAATDAVTVTADNEHPRFESLDIYPRTASGAIHLGAVVADAASAIQDVTYTVGEEDGSAMPADGSYNETRETVAAELDLTRLDSGNHTVTVSVVDSAGHLSRETRTITVDHGLAADLALDLPGRQNVTVGEEVTVTATVRNTGDVGERVHLAAATDLPVTVTQPVKRIGAGETRQFRLRVRAPADADYGPHPVNVSVDGLVTAGEGTLDVIVMPPATVRNTIEDRLARLQGNLSALRERRTEYDDGFGNRTLSAQFDTARETVEEARSAIQDGRYDRAQALLDAASAEMEQTENVFTGAVTQHRQRTLVSMVLTALLGLLVLGLVYGGYRIVPFGDGYDPENGFMHRPDGKHPYRVRAEAVMDEWQERWERFREDDGAADAGPTYTVDGWSGYDTEQ